jgi:hypothetical protein
MSAAKWISLPGCICLFAISACQTTRPTMSAVVKPTGPQWNSAASAQADLVEKEGIANDKRRSQALAENAAIQADVRAEALRSVLSDAGLNVARLPQAERGNAQHLEEAVSSHVQEAQRNEALAVASVNHANQDVANAKLAVAQTTAALTSITRDDFNKQFAKVISDCRAVIDTYQRGSKAGAKTAFWLQVSGLIAGAVVAPALVAASSVGNKAWIAGLSGYAGGTNLAENALGTSDLNGVSDATTSNQLATKIGSDITVALNKTNWDDKYDALNAVVADCSLFQIGVPAAPGNNGFSPPKTENSGSAP